MDMLVGPLRQLSAEELMLLNCGVGEVLSWVFFGRTDVEAETLILRPVDAKN